MDKFWAAEDHGYWSPTTSSLVWCEEKYVHSYYIAEFWNSISSFCMIILPLVNLLLGYNMKVDFPTLLCFWGTFVVGCGSFLFHATLKYPMQLLDELPMLCVGSVLIYGNFEKKAPHFCKKRMLMTAAIAYAGLTAMFYIWLKDPLIHQTACGFLVVPSIWQGFFATRFHGRKIRAMFVMTVVLYAAGFLLWLIDNEYCASLRYARRHILPSVVSPVSQFHAWWHVLVGFSGHLTIVLMQYIRLCELHKKAELTCYCGVLPYVRLQNQDEKEF